MILHGLLEAVAYTAGFALYRRLRSAYGDPIPNDTRWTVIAAAAVGAVVGSKVLYWFEDPRLLAEHWREPVFLMQGKTIAGGLIGGLIAVEWAKWLIGERRSTGDLFALPLCLGMAIGRIGCIIAGPADHTWGRETDSVVGIDGGDGTRRHCLPLYEIVFLAALSAILARLLRAPGRRSGDVFRVFMVGYFAFRLAAESLKTDPTLAGLTAIQWASAAVLVYYAAAVRARRAHVDLQTAR